MYHCIVIAIDNRTSWCFDEGVEKESEDEEFEFENGSGQKLGRGDALKSVSEEVNNSCTRANPETDTRIVRRSPVSRSTHIDA